MSFPSGVIYILQKKEVDILFGEHPNVWENVAWTDNFDDVLKWKSGAHRGEHRQYQKLSKKANSS